MIILEDDQKILNEGKKLIRSKTKSELDYYFELLRIYYVNYKKTQKMFIENNTVLKEDCMKFIKKNNIKISYKDNVNIGQGKQNSRGMGGIDGKSFKHTQQEHIPKFEEDTDDETEDKDEDKDENKDENKDNKNNKVKDEDDKNENKDEDNDKD